MARAVVVSFATTMLVLGHLLCPASSSTLRKQTNEQTNSNTTFVGAYFANWAQYHQNGYSFTAADLAPIASKLDEIAYSFFYFCPPASVNPQPYWAISPYGNCGSGTDPFQLLSVDPHDQAFLQTIVGFKSSNPALRLILSVGGWNFPSSYFSTMVSSKTSRSTFIASIQSWLTTYNADGISLDWEYPCSAPRTATVEITCTDFQDVADAGGVCPDDGDNFVILLQEMRETLGSKTIISVASQAGRIPEREMKISSLHPYVDRLEVMSYDYSVSDIPNAGVMAPNAPLFDPPASTGAPAMSINYTVYDYLADGVPRYKIIVGVPFYGHTWYNPTLASNASNPEQWASFGNPSYVQGDCCGPFMNTNGGKPGQGASQCGTMMYSEIQAAQPQKVFYDNVTQSNIGYFTDVGADGYTTPGTWITYNDAKSMKAITEYAVAENLGGIFAFDTSMDTRDSAGDFTFELTNAIITSLAEAKGK